MEASIVPLEPARMPSRQPRVLVVDDDPAIRLICATNLRLDGCEVIEAGDGQEALELARAEPPDLLLVDLSMPVLDGFGLAAALRLDERTSRLPFVFLTGEVDPHVEARAYAAGAHGFFKKPFDPAIIGLFVQRVLAELAAEPRKPAAPGGHSI